MKLNKETNKSSQQGRSRASLHTRLSLRWPCLLQLLSIPPKKILISTMHIWSQICSFWWAHRFYTFCSVVRLLFIFTFVSDKWHSANPSVRKWDLFSLILLAPFTLYVGLSARTFGSQPECNNAVKIVWFPHATTASFTWFRGFGIAIFVIYITVAVIHGVQLIFFSKPTWVGSASNKGFRWHRSLIAIILV